MEDATARKAKRENNKKVKEEKSEEKHRARLEAYKREEERIAEKMAVERQKLEAEYHDRFEALKGAEEKIAEKIAAERQALDAEYHDRFEALLGAEKKVATERDELEEEKHHLTETISAFNLRLAADDEVVRHEKLLELEGELLRLTRHRDRLGIMIDALHKTLEVFPELDREVVTYFVKKLSEETKKLSKEDVSTSAASMKSTFVQIEDYLLFLVLKITSILNAIQNKEQPAYIKKRFLSEISEGVDELTKILYGNIQYKFTPPLKSEREVQSAPSVVKEESVANSNMTEAKLADVVGFFERSVAAVQQSEVPELAKEEQQSAVFDEGAVPRSESPGV